MKNKSALAMAMMYGMIPLDFMDKSILRSRSPAKFYVPHQGKKECARRVQQNSGKRLDSKPRRMWTMNVGDPFGQHKSSRRTPLARLHFHKKFHCPVVLLP